MRRNRRHLYLVSIVALVNALVVFAIIGGFVSSIALLSASSVIDHNGTVRGVVLVGVALAIGAVWLVFEVWRLFHDASDDIGFALDVRPLAPEEAVVAELFDELSIATGLPSPAEIGIIDADVPNALALGFGGRRTAVIVTTGLVSSLSRAELEAMLATEVIASARLDVALRTVTAASSVRARSAFGEWVPLDHWLNPLFLLWTVVFSPTLLLTALVWRTALVRNGEEADALAVAVTRNPEALLHALRLLRADQRSIERVPAMTVPLWVEPEGVTTSGPSPFGPVSRLLDARIAHLAELCGEPND